ncbi:MAG: TIGR02147 family protein [Bdellovibrionales bacterium]
MWIAEFNDYKTFLKAVIAGFPKKGRGQARRLAEHLRVAPVVVSQILTGDRHFTIDQAIKVAHHFGLEPKATDYFVNLVIQARADTKELKLYYEEKLSKFREEAQTVNAQLTGRQDLSDLEKGTFYSNWYYSGVRLLTSIKGYQSVDAIADYFGLSRAKIGDIISFLLETGLCVQEDGRIRMGAKWTHVSEKSPFVNGHRRNWREKALEKFAEPGIHDLFYSSPVSISQKDAENLRKELLKLIKDFSKQVETSPEEKLMCLNIDWFEF